MFRKTPILFAIGLAASCLLPIKELPAQDASGVWRGSWTSQATANRRAHGGSLRVRLRPGPQNTYRGTFMGRFAVVVPYFYRATVYQVGHELHSSKRLGPMGVYRMTLYPSRGGMSGRWSASGHTGAIHLRRR